MNSLTKLLSESKRLRDAASGNGDSEVTTLYLHNDATAKTKDAIINVLTNEDGE